MPDAAATRGLLLDAARELVAEHGTATSLREIARRAGVGIGTLYRHFPNREALLDALLHANFERLQGRAATLLGSPDPADALLTWLAELASGAATYDGLPESIMSALADESSPLYASCSQMKTAAGLLLRRAQEVGLVRADVTVGDAVALVLGLAWSGGRAGEASDLAARLLTR
ncbi:TetR family transcriptional regulator [Asanoa ishikariensis]|uniref:Transcriptional regulator, TetR family n=1 Tax=Asanoa ishikariensis TaxID=137265 RepID=A0A1H3TKK1_9ACTN|nr:TetR/AcrR family transcriptional regulator [Asanoa ishikariensis]GIF62308.1 TetR family transcriptional regulator [Asanoa ishikariensis]SDZ50388.1 transcriptional regulator, TetR family [Asanoa ishikariensis]